MLRWWGLSCNGGGAYGGSNCMTTACRKIWVAAQSARSVG